MDSTKGRRGHEVRQPLEVVKFKNSWAKLSSNLAKVRFEGVFGEFFRKVSFSFFRFFWAQFRDVVMVSCDTTAITTDLRWSDIKAISFTSQPPVMLYFNADLPPISRTLNQQTRGHFALLKSANLHCLEGKLSSYMEAAKRKLFWPWTEVADLPNKWRPFSASNLKLLCPSSNCRFGFESEVNLPKKKIPFRPRIWCWFIYEVKAVSALNERHRSKQVSDVFSHFGLESEANLSKACLFKLF